NGLPDRQELTLHVETVVDIASTLSAERNDSSSMEVVTWALALQASIVSHQRDLHLLMPWMNPGAELSGTSPSPTVPSLVDLANKSHVAAQSLKKRLEALIELVGTMFDAMDFDLLFDSD